MAAAQGRHQHRRRPYAHTSVASIDLSGPHIPTPLPGKRVSETPGRYFLVLTVRPDDGGGHRTIATQCCDEEIDVEVVEDPQPHAAPPQPDQNGDDEQAEDDIADEELTTSSGPLIYTKVLVSRGESTMAVMELLARVKEELGYFPYRLHSGKSSCPKS